MYSSDMFMAESVADATVNSAPMMGLFLGIMIFICVLGLILIISNWKIFNKAGKPGWASIVPIYNCIVMIQIAKLSMVYLLLLIIPFINIYAIFKINIEISKKFGKSTGFGIGMALASIIFIPLLAFSDNVYEDYQEVSSKSNLDDTNSNVNSMNTIIQNNEETRNIGDAQENIGIESNNIETVNSNFNINQAPVMEVENMQQNIVVEPQIENDVSSVENKIEEAFENKPIQEMNNNDIPVINDVLSNDSIVVEQNEVPVQEEIIEVPNALNLKPLELQPQVEETPSLNDDASVNLEKNTNEISTPEIVPQPITEIPVINETVNSIEQKKICKNCGEILPNIVSICPKCGTDNE